MAYRVKMIIISILYLWDAVNVPKYCGDVTANNFKGLEIFSLKHPALQV
jgi:hypothetical protein